MVFSKIIQNTRMWFDKEMRRYDRELWEQTVEKGVTEKLSHPYSKRILDDIVKNTIKKQMIDVDLITGATLSKSKAREPFSKNCMRGILNGLFPFNNSEWWISQIGFRHYVLLIIFYTVNLITILKSLLWSDSWTEEVRKIEPIILSWTIFLALSIIVSHVFNQSTPKTEDINKSCDSGRGSRKTADRGKKQEVPTANIEEYLIGSSEETEYNRISPNTSNDNIRDFAMRDKSLNLKNELMVSEIETGESESECITEEYNNEGDSNEKEFKQSSVNYRNLDEAVQKSVERVGCIIKENGVLTKEYLTVNEIGNIIVLRSNNSPEKITFIVFAFFSSLFVALITPIHNYSTISSHDPQSLWSTVDQVLGDELLDKFVTLNFVLQKFFLNFYITFLLTLAERSCRQRLRYYKNFDMVTSLRRSQKNGVPYFRLNAVRKVKLWLSLRSYIKKCGPIRQTQIIVSFTFYAFLGLFVLLGIEINNLKSDFFSSKYSWELCCWIIVFGLYLLRFITDQVQYNKAAKNGNILLTEKFNIYQSIDQKPAKKEKYLLTVKTLDIAFDIIRNVEKSFKISTVFGNPILFSVLHVVLFSTLTALLNELLGFKLKFFKIKI